MPCTAWSLKNIYFIYIWRRQWHPTPVLLPGKSHGWRSLVGCSPSGRYELDMTERLHFHFSLSHIGEGNGNPLQCSCLENPRDGGAWWAAVYGVAQGQTWLKWLSSIYIYICLPTNSQDWSPLGWTGWISLQSKGLSKVFSNNTVQKHQFFSAQLSYSPNLTSIHDYWKNHRFD